VRSKNAHWKLSEIKARQAGLGDATILLAEAASRNDFGQP
jgi:hypothetical protein